MHEGHEVFVTRHHVQAALGPVAVAADLLVDVELVVLVEVHPAYGPVVLVRHPELIGTVFGCHEGGEKERHVRVHADDADASVDELSVAVDPDVFAGPDFLAVVIGPFREQLVYVVQVGVAGGPSVPTASEKSVFQHACGTLALHPTGEGVVVGLHAVEVAGRSSHCAR